MEHMPPLRRADETAVDLEQFPPLPTTSYYKLDPKVRYLWLMGRMIMWAILFLGGGFYLMVRIFSGRGLGIIELGVGAFALFLCTLHLIWPFFAYKHWGFAVRQTDFLVRSGVLFRRVTAIPFARIQHVDSDAGPIERGMGLASVIVYTAGSGIGSTSVPGLPEKDAESLRDYLSKVGHTHANL